MKTLKCTILTVEDWRVGSVAAELTGDWKRAVVL
jgi:hypothetical protein